MSPERGQRVAVFRKRAVVNVDDAAIPASAPWSERLSEVSAEVLRLMRDGTCTYCSTVMRDLASPLGRLLLCPYCGYWGGRGMRFEMGPVDRRGVVGLVERFDLDSSELELGELLGHLRTHQERLLQLSPFRAEQIVMDVLREVLECEVRPVGGVKDGGVDGYIVAGDRLKTIVQVKWHESTRGAESVRMIREIAGTLVARGVPSGLLVTTRASLSKAAQDEISAIERQQLSGLGKLRIDAKTYGDILDMLNLAWTRLGGDFEAVNPALQSEDAQLDVFDGLTPDAR